MKQLMKMCSRRLTGLCVTAHIHACPPHYDMSPFHGANTKTAFNGAPQSQPELLHGILAKSIPRLRCLPRNKKKKPGSNLRFFCVWIKNLIKLQI